MAHSSLLGVLAIFFAWSSVAYAQAPGNQTPRAIRANRANRAAPMAARDEPKTSPLPQWVASLPAQTPLVIYAPSLSTLVVDARELIELASLIDPTLTPQGAVERAARRWWGGGSALLRSPEDAKRWTTLFHRAALHAIGVDQSAPVVVVPPNAPNGGWLVAFGVRDRARFEAWLDELAGSDRRRIEVAGEQASLLALDSNLPVTCLTRRDVAYCQLGAEPGTDPIALLRKVTRQEAPTLGSTRGVVRALEALPTGAHAYALVNPQSMSQVASRFAAAHEARAASYEAKKHRTRSKQVSGYDESIRAFTSWVEGAAVGVYPAPGGVRLEVQLALSDSGDKVMRNQVLASGAIDDRILRWARTPALFSLVARANPALLERVASWVGAPLPAGALDGTLAILTMGVDTECPLAKRAAADADRLGWAFVLPTAVAVGLRPNSADLVQGTLRAELGEPPEPPEWRKAKYAALGAGTRPRFVGTMDGSPYEVIVLDDVMIGAAGHGMGAAALRRLGARSEAPLLEVAPLFELTLNAGDIDAALPSGALGSDEHRPVLVALDQLRGELRPLLDRVRSVYLVGRNVDGARRVQLQARFSR